MLFKWFISNPYSNRQFELEPISKVADIQKYTVLNFPVGRATQLNMKSNTLTSSRNIASVPQENIIYLIILSHILPQSFVIAIPILMTTCRDKPTGIALLLRSLNSIQYIQYLWYCAVPSLVAQLCPTLGDPMDCSLPCSSVLGIFQATTLEWVALFFSRGSSQPRDRNWVSRNAGRFSTN